MLSRAQMRLHLGNLDDARKDFNAILQHQPESTEALIGRSVLAEKSGDLTSAQQDLQKANEINPDDTEGVEIARLRMQATIAHRAEQFDEAIAACS
ncbi:MAG: tetratricopeptide repeat protein, partial [Planctomycetaceae bacterium]